MTEKIRKLVYQTIATVDFYGDEDVYNYLILGIANTFAMVMHVLLVFLFLIGGSKGLAAINCCSVLIYYLNLTLFVRTRNYSAAGLVLAIEVSAYVSASIFCVGPDNNIQLYLILVMLMQLSVPYASLRIRGVITFVLWAAVVGVVFLRLSFKPYSAISSPLMVAYSIFNIQLFFIGAIMLLFVGNIIKNFVEEYKTSKLLEFETQAHTDPLTGLYNRRYAENLFHRLEEESDNIARCVAIIDIDDFKLVNDRYGHSAGDLVLEDLARIMRNSLRKTDVIFRWGGEEFLILLDNVTPQLSYVILDKLRLNIKSNVVKYNGTDICVTATIGVAEFDVKKRDESINNCDNNLYKGKLSGKDQVVI